MILKFLLIMVYSAFSQSGAPTNIFCKADNQNESVQLYCGSRWSDISNLPQIEGRFQNCSGFQGGVLILRVGDAELEINDLEFPIEVTLNGVEVECDELSSVRR